MLKFGFLFMLLCAIGLQSNAQYSPFVVQGHIYDNATAMPVSGFNVYVYADTNKINWYYKNIVTTDSTGFYSLTITPPKGATIQFFILSKDCKGSFYRPFNNSSSVATLDFYICTNTNPSCKALFKWDFDSQNSNLVNFHNGSTGNIAKWEWDFGDKTTSTLQNPLHKFYKFPAKVCLKVTDSSGTCVNSVCKIVGDTIIYSKCIAQFKWDFDSQNSNLVNFHNGSTGNIAKLEWDFGDKTTSTLQNPSHKFYKFPAKVCLKVTDSSGTCVNSVCKIVGDTIIYSKCIAQFKWDLNTRSSNLVNFYDGSTGNIAKWEWDFGDKTTSTLQNPSHTFYKLPAKVCLKVTDSSGTCTNSVCNMVGDSIIYSNCKSQFKYITSGDTVSFYSYGIDTMKKIIYNWDFGDKSTSHLANPVHVYSSQSVYNVCLKVFEIDSKGDTCFSQYCNKIYFNIKSSNEIAGIVYSANGLSTEKAMVYLIYYNPKDSILTAVDSMMTMDSLGIGYFQFDGIKSGDFLLKAFLTPKSANYKLMLPTYFDTSLFWYNATTLTLYPNVANYVFTKLEMINGKNPGGPGFIGGKVTQGANILISGNEGDFIPNVEVLVTDMNNTPYIYDYSDKNGSFDLNQLPYGTYKIYAEIPGFITSPAIVTLSAEKPSVNIDFVVTEKVVTSSIKDEKSINFESLGIYPNPVRDQLNFQINSMVSEQGTIEILNSTGKLVNKINVNIESGNTILNIKTDELINSGFYIIRLISGSGVKTASFIYLK